MAGRSVTIAAPPGLCIDRGSTRVDAGRRLRADARLRRSARPRGRREAALTASVSSGGLTGEGDAAADTLRDLQAFLATRDGLALSAAAAAASGVRVLAQQLRERRALRAGRGPGPQPIAGLDRQVLARLPRGQRPDDRALGARLRRRRRAAAGARASSPRSPRRSAGPTPAERRADQTMPPPPPVTAGRSAATFGAVAGAAEGGDGVDGGALVVPSHGEDRLDVGAEGGLERGGRHQGVVGLLVAVEGGAVDEEGLDVGALDLHGARHQALDRVGDVVALVDHVGGVEGRRRGPRRRRAR